MENYCWHNPHALQSTVKRWKPSETSQLHPSGLDRLLGQLMCSVYDLMQPKSWPTIGKQRIQVIQDWRQHPGKQQPWPAWDCGVGTALQALWVRANEALGCGSMDLMDTPLVFSPVLLRPLLKYWTTVVMSTLGMLKTLNGLIFVPGWTCGLKSSPLKSLWAKEGKFGVKIIRGNSSF